jgi:hypothetical protein
VFEQIDRKGTAILTEVLNRHQANFSNMKRMIRRTEITIETVEITTIRRIRPEAGEEVPLRNEMTGTTVIGCAAALAQM